ncbi:uncharacterized protein LOC125298760 isoform X1 [Alosa alosa]|uniref:uncharacterized protein LOC125298760 isoform X1 n=1 Tax=Alosa alosa TaxID=278164 RepID=UPI0020153576|nr:uncharacterized protein LOC125298760 isoform X1 [Alosa alosa]
MASETGAHPRVVFQTPRKEEGEEPPGRRLGKLTVKYDRKDLQRRLDIEEWIEGQLHLLFDCEAVMEPGSLCTQCILGSFWVYTAGHQNKRHCVLNCVLAFVRGFQTKHLSLRGNTVNSTHTIHTCFFCETDFMWLMVMKWISSNQLCAKSFVLDQLT